MIRQRGTSETAVSVRVEIAIVVGVLALTAFAGLILAWQYGAADLG